MHYISGFFLRDAILCVVFRHQLFSKSDDTVLSDTPYYCASWFKQ